MGARTYSSDRLNNTWLQLISRTECGSNRCAMSRIDEQNKLPTHPTIIGTALVEFAIGGVGESTWAVGFVAGSPVTATIDEVEWHRVCATRNNSDEPIRLSNEVLETTYYRWFPKPGPDSRVKSAWLKPVFTSVNSTAPQLTPELRQLLPWFPSHAMPPFNSPWIVVAPCGFPLPW